MVQYYREYLVRDNFIHKDDGSHVDSASTSCIEVSFEFLLALFLLMSIYLLNLFEFLDFSSFYWAALVDKEKYSN